MTHGIDYGLKTSTNLAQIRLHLRWLMRGSSIGEVEGIAFCQSLLTLFHVSSLLFGSALTDFMTQGF